MLDASSTSSGQQLQSQPSSSAPRLPPSDSTPNLTASPSPPRFIPPHMVLEGARNGRSPTPELTGTTVSSPSAAYDGLTLDSEGSGDISGPEELGTEKSTNIVVLRDLNSRSNISNRSLSPATKRTLSDMEEAHSKNQERDIGADQQRNVTLDPASGPVESGSPVKNLQNQANWPRREMSVDRLAYETSSTLEQGNGPTAKTISLAKSAYQSPPSGTPSASSCTSSQEASSVSPSSSTAGDIPSIDEQIEQVLQLAHKPLQQGQKGFIISKKWLSRVLSRGSSTEKGEKFEKAAREGVIGPVDNTGINTVLDPAVGSFTDEAGEIYAPLRPGLQLSEDFEILPQEAWDLIMKWYGLATGSTIITRYCHNTSTSETQENLQFELYPPIFSLLKLPDTSEGLTTKALKEKDASPIKILASRHERFVSFLKRAKILANIDVKSKVRIWRILGGLGGGVQPGMITPAQSRSNSPAPNFIAPVDPGTHLVMDVNSFADLQLGSQRELIEANDETANEKYNGHSTLDIIGLRQDEVIVLEEQIGGPGGGEWVSDVARKQAKTNGVALSVTKNGSTVVRDSLKPGSKAGSGRTSPATGGMMTRGRQQKNGRTRGTNGLGNLGNTCYMNSALQCIRSVEELTHYFLLDKYKKDLNPNNPLSHNGQVAKAYAALLNEMYPTNASYSFSPRNFKNVIGKYGPSFSGYQQQDSQEFLLFLLDGLQEDLSRIHKKPYIEKPDSTDEMVNDPVALRAMADKCWEIYQARNDSVITDLFAGMYKSTVVCPVCDKVSIIFDPFNNLTLQLPIENLWSKPIFFFPLHSRPIRVTVDIDKNATFMDLKTFVAKRVGADPVKTVVAEIYKCRIYKMFDDKKTIGDERIAETDSIAIFELENQPSNFPPPKRVQKSRPMAYFNHSDEEEDVPEGDSPLADQMLVAVFNRQVKDGGSRFQQRVIFGVPSYIIVTREEAHDYDAILRKVLAKVDTMTTLDILQDEGASNDSGPEDSDGVLMNTDDGDSSTDSKFQAKSLESEDELVDISMRDGGEEPSAMDRPLNPLPGIKHKRLPRMLQPGQFIPPEVRNLFEMKYFSSNNEMIPTGWSTLQDETKDYPTLQSRRPIMETARRRDTKSKIQRRLQRLGSASSSDADEDVDSVPLPGAQISYDSDSDGLPPVEKVTQAPVGFGRFDKNTPRNSKGLITYSRKGKNVAYPGDHEDSQPETNGTPLIRLGEALVLDWPSDVYDSLFTGMETTNREPEIRGSPTWEEIPPLPDPELEEKRRQRASRKRNGVSLEDCLDEFGKAEILSENDAWYCPRCKEHRRASKTFELWKAPDVLVIHLKRFSAQGRNLRDKLDVLVDFPVEGLDLSSRVAMQEEGKSPLYDLFAVDNHYGGLGGGHYTAFAQNFYDKNWYEYNDSSVSRRANPDVVVTSAAYLLFYRRRAPHPLGGPFFEQLIGAANNPTPQSQPASRTTSPAGEGKRLDDSPSRNGSSSASAGAGATHQAGGGGLAAATTAARTRTGVDDDLPSYSYSVNNADDQPAGTLESMEMDEEDEAIGIGEYSTNTFGNHGTNWSFAGLSTATDEEMTGMPQRIAAPPGSDQDGEEDLFDEDSTKAVSPSSDSDRHITDFAEEEGPQLPSFVDDEGTTSGAFGPYRSGSTPVQDIPPLLHEEYDDPAVAEVRVNEGEMYNLD